MRRTSRQIDVSFSWVCSLIGHELRYNIVKVAVDPLACEQAHVWVTRESDAKSEPANEAIRRGGVWCGSAEKVPAMISVLNFLFSLCLSKVKTIGWKARKVGKLLIHYVWWGAVRSSWSRWFSARVLITSTVRQHGFRGRGECVCVFHV